VTDLGGARRDADLFLDAHPAPLILDEIQFAPELTPAIKRRVDEAAGQSGGLQSGGPSKPGQYILTGSRQWSVLRTASESLAGRAVFVDLEGFSLAELSAEPIAWEVVDAEHAGIAAERNWFARYLADLAAFMSAPLTRLPRARTLHEQLWRGFLPMTDQLDLAHVPSFLKAYLRTYIERDVRLIGEVADWQQFRRFVQLASALTAQEINAPHLGREIGLTPKTTSRGLSMLSATYR